MSDTKILDDVFQLVHALKKTLHSEVEGLNLPFMFMHIRVLKIISAKSSCTAIDIAHHLSRDKAQVTRLLNGLVEDGLIIRQANPEDKRSHCLHFTTAGKAVAEKIKGIDDIILQRITNNISEQELVVFQKTIRTMARNLN